MLVGQQIGPFTIEREIGAGAMGTVYRASYTKTGLKVAIKILAPGLADNPNTLARFERETAILKKLHHPNIVRLYATGRVQGTPFYAMEYVDGESLDKVLERRGRFTWEEVINLGREVCAALQHAHDQGIIHRDLKPGNIMMADGTAKLTDFGIAKGLEANALTATNATIGTAAYMSPEQCRGERNLTPKSDLYSLGVLFYELLTGRLPFSADSIMDMFLAHVQWSFERPSRLVLDIPIWLDTLVCQLMEKDPNKRPLDAAMVSHSLNDCLEKMAAQRSAGVDVVSARAIDVRKKFKPDEADRETARVLRAAVTKTHLKRRTRPFYERVWFQGVAASALLVVMGGGFWWLTRPPAPEVLFRRAEELMSSRNPDDHDKARTGPIKRFLQSYPDLNSEEAEQIRRWADEVDLATRERQLQNRMKLELSPDDASETQAQKAVRQEEAGDWQAAYDHWHALEKLKDDADPDQRAWGLLAAKRIDDLQTAQAREEQLSRTIDQTFLQGQEFMPPSAADRLAIRALRYEKFGDVVSALKDWQELKQTCPPGDGQHIWLLLAAKKIAELQVKQKTDPADLLQKKLAQVELLRQSDLWAALIICKEMVALYDRHPDLAELVQKARLFYNHFRRIIRPPPPRVPDNRGP